MSTRFTPPLHFLRITVFALMTALVNVSTAQAQTTPSSLRVMTHDSFALSPELLKQFEQDNHVTLALIKGGDAGEMLNKLILTRANPLADVVYGIDNSLLDKARQANILAPTRSIDAKLLRTLPANLQGMASVDYGWVALNYDRAKFSKDGQKPLPTSLDDLTQPAYRHMLVVPNPATSSTGRAFLLATVAHFGVEKAFDWWRAMRRNEAKVAPNWTDAYYTDFSRNGGAYPIVVSYASSPAAEVAFSKTPLTESPTANLLLKGSVYEQIEGAALLAGTKERVLGQKFIDFLQSKAVQADLPTQMWMWPVLKSVAVPAVFKHAQQPKSNTANQKIISAKVQDEWVKRWVDVMTH